MNAVNSIGCPKCGHANPEGARFCEECGTPISAAEPSRPKPQPGRPDRITIGSADDNDVVLKNQSVAAYHAVLHIRGERLMIEDLKSPGGTFVDTPEQRVARKEITLDTPLYIGAFPVSVRRLIRACNLYMPAENAVIPYPGRRFPVGRHESCPIRADHPAVGSKHAEFAFEDGQLVIRNPEGREILINDKPMKRDTEALKPGDRIFLGPLLLIPEKKGLRCIQTWRQHFLEARNISRWVRDRSGNDKVLLDHISLVIYPGEFCGLMGMAGAGKSMLMKALNGYDKPSDGKVLINGLDIYEHYDSFKTAIGYVPQEDIFHKDLTVEQALSYAAELRLGRPLDDTEKNTLIQRVLERLAMFDTNAEIRTTRINQISGGQKRRLNIAIEMLTDPSVFFLDEPTSGLSSEDALVVMELLQSMAHEGKTILMSLHQPSSEIYGMMDNVIYMHRGGVMVYKGPGRPDAILFTNPDIKPDQAHSPDLVLRALDKQEPDAWRKQYRKSPYFKELIKNRHLKVLKNPRPPKPEAIHQAPPLFQWLVLFQRHIRVTFQDPLNALVLLLQSPVIALLIALIFRAEDKDSVWETAPTVHFLMVVASVWFGCSNAAREICGEWPIYQRERMFNLKIAPYVLSKLATGAMISLVQCLMLVFIVMPVCNLEAPFLSILAVLWMAAVSGICIGLFVSAFASPFKKSNEIAIGLIPIILLPMVILAGMIKPVKEMGEPTRILASAMPTRWAFEALMVLESERTTGDVTIETPMGNEKKRRHEAMMEPLFEEKRHHPVTAMIGPIVIGLVFLLGTAAYLRKRDMVT